MSVCAELRNPFGTWSSSARNLSVAFPRDRRPLPSKANAEKLDDLLEVWA